METLKFLTPEQAESVRSQFGTPVYVYDERTLKAQAPRGASTSPMPSASPSATR